MRLFVALEPPRSVLAEVEAVIAPVRPAWPGLRWASQDKWHVTLAFLGEVDEGKLGELARRLERAAGRHPVLELVVGRVGALPSPGRARVLCAHIEGEERSLARLSELAASVAAGARRAGAPPPDEGRRYRPHLTLARSRQPTDLGPLVRDLNGLHGSAWTAATVHLIRSQTGPQATYEPVGSWPLRAG